jgi:tetrahydromethanopterin S-methyltransferase subunit A
VDATWPVLDGNYIVGDPNARVAVCTLTNDRLPAQIAALPGVAIAGTLATANLGIERLVINVLANPAIDHLLLCGRDSPIFGPGQSLAAMAHDGVDDNKRIFGAVGFDPVLPSLTVEQVDEFRAAVNVIDCTGTDDLAVIAERAAQFADAPRTRLVTRRPIDVPADEFAVLPAGGGRGKSVEYDPAGFLVITIDESARQIRIRHYRSDNTPAHEIRSRNGEAILLALVRNGLVTQLDHAGYLGAELAKAETALRLGLRYVQDRPLPRPTQHPDATTSDPQSSHPQTGNVPTNGTTAEPANAQATAAPGVVADGPRQAGDTPSGESIQLVIEVISTTGGQTLHGFVADPDPADPYARYVRTSQRTRARYNVLTRIAMGTAQDVTAGALLRVRGTIQADGMMDIEAMAILTHVATVITA